MGYKDKFKASEDKPIYTRSQQLTEFVAFKSTRAARVENKMTGKESNVMFLKYQPGLILQFYGDKDFQELTAEEVTDFNSDLQKGEEFFVVPYGEVGDYVVTKILPLESVSKTEMRQFHPSIHKLIDLKNEASSSKSLKINHSDLKEEEDGSSKPWKKQKSE